MFWFSPSERGLALGIRQTAVPLGALLVAIVVPPLAAEGGSAAAFLFLAGLSAVGAAAGGLVLRDRAVDEIELELEPVVRTLRDRRIWRLSFVSALYGYPQVAIIGFRSPVPARRARPRRRRRRPRHRPRVDSRCRIAHRRRPLVGRPRIADRATPSARPCGRLRGRPDRSARRRPARAARGQRRDLRGPVDGVERARVHGRCRARRGGEERSCNRAAANRLSASGMIGPPLFAATVSAGSWSAAFVIAALFPIAGSLMLRPFSGH